MHSLCLHIVCYVCKCERNDAIVCIVYIGLCVCVCIERESQRSLLYIFFVRRDSISALLCASEPVRAYAHGCVCAFQCTCASHCQQLVLRCRQESPVTHITASSHCVLNQLCFSMLSKTLSHTHDACARVCVCAHTCTEADVRLFVRVHRSGRVCLSCYHDHTQGQRSKAARPEEERNGEWD